MQSTKTLQKEVQNLKLKLEQRDAKLEQKNHYIKTLEAALIDFKKNRFGAKSEKVDSKQIPLFNEVEVITDAIKPSKPKNSKKKTGVRKSLPKELERIEKVHDLPDNQKNCPNDGSTLKHIGEIVTEQFYFKPAEVKVIKHKQYKYACPCCNKYVVLAQKPKDIIPKSMATPELLSYICTSKYADGLPLHRLSLMFKRIDVKISRQVMASWMILCAKAIQPLVNLIRDELYNQPCIHIDESPIQVLKEVGKKASSKSYMWVQRAGNNILFNYYPTRSSKEVEKLLANYKGTIMSDGYIGYDAIAQKFNIIHLACWVHARRYFMKVLDHGENPNAQKIIGLIGQLYGIEKQIKTLAPVEVYRHRQERSKPILDEIKNFLDIILHSTTPSGAMGKALKYLSNQWHKLIKYIDNGNYPIDNNAAENAIRPFVIGRKNWLFANTPEGANASANLYSLIETAKAHGLNPEQYLTYIFKKLPLVKTIEDYEMLLPWNFKS
ncbi:MAG: IS66 family transposase [Proteobacteria bacterium]|nr:IS66 family transposase [Pseudomonadota bacterium]